MRIDFLQDWKEWFRGEYNWYSFTIVHLDYEDEAYIGRRCVSAGLLGFNVRLAWNYKSAKGDKNRSMIQARLDDFLKASGATSVAIHPDALADLLEKAGEKKDDEVPPT